jgi:hypothetical protein
VQPLHYGTAGTRLGVGKEKGGERKRKKGREKERRKENRKNELSIF